MSREEIELARAGLKAFDQKPFFQGHLTPVFFGSALRNSGVCDFIDSLSDFAPSPHGLQAASRTVEAREEKMTGFVFKSRRTWTRVIATGSLFCAFVRANWREA